MERSERRIAFICAKNWYFILDPIHFFTTPGSRFFCSVWLTCGIRAAIWLEFLPMKSKIHRCLYFTSWYSSNAIFETWIGKKACRSQGEKIKAFLRSLCFFSETGQISTQTGVIAKYQSSDFCTMGRKVADEITWKLMSRLQTGLSVVMYGNVGSCMII